MNKPTETTEVKKTTRRRTNSAPQSIEFAFDPALNDTESLKHSVSNHMRYTVGKNPITAKQEDWETSVARMARDRMVERWQDTTKKHYDGDMKRVYYMSMEFLVGRALSNSLLALGIYDHTKDALQQMGLDLDEIVNQEPDAALGNGGLGRLAACFLDSMATLGLPAYGYGIRYDYGMFAQKIVDGRQVETPDHWLVGGNPWEYPRAEVAYTIKYNGRVERDAQGRAHWVDTENIHAMAYDTIVPGYDTSSVITMRLWSAKAVKEIDLGAFGRGEYTGAIEDKNHSENVSRVLYPDDSTQAGRELRLRQEYFFSSASLQDILRRYLKSHHQIDASRGDSINPSHFDDLPDHIAVQLNDTHPAISVAELMRLLIDEYGLEWSKAWQLCQRIFAYTNHTIMAEALESWPVAMVGSLLPRHLEIIFEINAWFLNLVREKFGNDNELLRRVSIIDEDQGRRVRMAFLSVVASHKVNGVAALHSDLIKQTIFADFNKIFPGRLINVTNGITPRRWLGQANQPLSSLLDAKIGTSWRKDLGDLKKLAPLAEDKALRKEFAAVKLANKQRLAETIQRLTGIEVNPHSLFDVQIKRIHEYKRQLLNVLHVITRYNRIIANPDANWVPRTVIFAGKAASAYFMAKLIIKLIHDVARTVNNDPRVKGLLKVVFVPNYSVSLAEQLMPAADLSEQISTAGTEASGTGNMKMALNGALTIGTMDGANIEIGEHVGFDNMFIFGLLTPEVQKLKADGYDAQHYYDTNPELRQVLNQIGSGYFSPEEPSRFHPVVDSLLRHGDHYLLLADYASYVAAQEKVDEVFRNPEEWTRRAVLNTANMGFFSTDRTIAEYAEKIWHVKSVHDVKPKRTTKKA